MPLHKKIMTSLARGLIFILLGVTAFSINLPAYADPIEAQWQVHQFRFRYSGFNTHYTCDGIKRTLKRLLRLVGARDDVRIESSCHNPARVQRFHRVLLAFAIPVAADKTDISREIIPAEWQEVRIVGNISRYMDAGDCELIDQFYRQVLSKLSVRKVKKSLFCTPRGQGLSTLNIRMITLKALEKAKLEEGQSDTQAHGHKQEN
jgi:hypothetical protein